MSKSKKSILIVGGTGFIGYHLAKESLKKGWLVTSISTRKPKKLRKLKKVKYIICDITKKNSLDKKVKQQFTYVVNLGGYVDHSNKAKTYRSHYLGCKNLTEILSRTAFFFSLGRELIQSRNVRCGFFWMVNVTFGDN